MAHAASGDSTGNVAHCAVGILDFYHAQHLWQAASLYQDGNPAHTQQQWFARMRHQLRHGFVSALSKNGLVKQV